MCWVLNTIFRSRDMYYEDLIKYLNSTEFALQLLYMLNSPELTEFHPDSPQFARIHSNFIRIHPYFVRFCLNSPELVHNSFQFIHKSIDFTQNSLDFSWIRLYWSKFAWIHQKSFKFILKFLRLHSYKKKIKGPTWSRINS